MVDTDVKCMKMQLTEEEGEEEEEPEGRKRSTGKVYQKKAKVERDYLPTKRWEVPTCKFKQITGYSKLN